MIIKPIGEMSYRIKSPDRWKLIHNIFHETLLTPYIKPKFRTQRKKVPIPEIIGDKLHYEVEKILDSCLRNRAVQYLVRWKGYAEEHNSWAPKNSLTATTSDCVRKFHDRYPLKPGRTKCQSIKKTFDRLQSKAVEKIFINQRKFYDRSQHVKYDRLQQLINRSQLNTTIRMELHDCHRNPSNYNSMCSKRECTW